MTLKDVISDDIAAVFLDTDEHGETIRYTPAGLPERTIVGILDFDEQILTTSFNDGRGCERTARLFIAHRDSDGVAMPAEGDLVVVADGSRWRVQGKPEADNFGGCWLTIVRFEQAEKSGRDYRIDRAR